MEDTIKKIEECLTLRIINENYACCCPDKYSFIKRRVLVYYLFLTTNMSIIDIEKEVLSSHNIPIKFNSIKTDFLQYNFLLNNKILNMDVNKIKDRYVTPPDEVEERMMFRIELYKEGWNVEQIENYIYKYILKKETPIIDTSVYNYYTNTMNLLNIYNKEREKRIGRPSLPPLLKEYVNKKHKRKVKEGMRKRYKHSNSFESIKSNLLTNDELQVLEDMFEDKNDKLLLKLKRLNIRDI